MTILAIDPGTHLGWATWDGERRDSGTWDNPWTHAKWPRSFFKAYKEWLGDMWRWHKPTELWLAKTFSKSTATREVLLGIRSITLVWSLAHNMSCPQYLSEGTARKAVLGHGRPGKDKIVRMVQERFGWTGTSHDEADAIVILEFAKLKGIEIENRHARIRVIYYKREDS